MSKHKSIDRQRRTLLQYTGTLFGAMPLLAACGPEDEVVAQTEGLSGSTSRSSMPVPVAPPSATPPPPDATAPPTAPLPPSQPGPATPTPLPPMSPTPAWSTSVPTDTWHRLSGTAFSPWALANIPRAAYQGTDPFNSIVNAYCDPAYSPTAGTQYFYGGGHGDGTCNAVCKFDHSTLAWSLAAQPTPPSKYPPSYFRGGAMQPGPLVYPSGLDGGGFFLSSNELSNAADVPYAAPLARASTHMYAAAAMRGSRIHYFYLTYAEFDVLNGEWSGRGVDLGAQLLKFRPEYGAWPLQQGTVAIYDDVTDRFLITLNPGDNGGGWRSGILVFNPITRVIESIFETNEASYGLVLNSINVCRVGRDLYCFTKTGRYDQPQVMNQGFIFNMDTHTFKRFTLVGDIAGTAYTFSTAQDAIPSWYDGRAIHRWNYQSSERNKIYSVSLTPRSGSGKPTDPLVLTQTVRSIGGEVPAKPTWVFSRFVFNGGAACALLLPEAGADWVALKLS